MEDTHAPHVLGRNGEEWARAHLERNGWLILANNYRSGRREVDLIARKRGILAFVEVKTRSGTGYGPPEEAVTRLKRREIEAVAQAYLCRHGLEDVDVRFDVIAILAGPRDRLVRLEHLEDAWRPDPPR